MKVYVAICRNYFNKKHDKYFALYSDGKVNKSTFLNGVISLGYEPIRIITLNENKENKLFSTYSHVNFNFNFNEIER